MLTYRNVFEASVQSIAKTRELAIAFSLANSALSISEGRPHELAWISYVLGAAGALWAAMGC